jgi:hypothetical protein
LFYIFLQFYLTSLREKRIFAKEPEPGVFGPLEPEPLEKKYQEPQPLGKKIRSRSRLKKKSGAGATKKICRLPSPGADKFKKKSKKCAKKSKLCHRTKFSIRSDGTLVRG